MFPPFHFGAVLWQSILKTILKKWLRSHPPTAAMTQGDPLQAHPPAKTGRKW